MSRAAQLRMLKAKRKIRKEGGGAGIGGRAVRRDIARSSLFNKSGSMEVAPEPSLVSEYQRSFLETPHKNSRDLLAAGRCSVGPSKEQQGGVSLVFAVPEGKDTPAPSSLSCSVPLERGAFDKEFVFQTPQTPAVRSNSISSTMGGPPMEVVVGGLSAYPGTGPNISQRRAYGATRQQRRLQRKQQSQSRNSRDNGHLYVGNVRRREALSPTVQEYVKEARRRVQEGVPVTPVPLREAWS